MAARSLVCIAAAVLVFGAACGDSTGPGGSGASSQGGNGAGSSTGGEGGISQGGNPPLGGMGGTGTGGSGGGMGGEGGMGGGVNPSPGAPGNAFVSSGNRASSTNYSVVHTTGQSTINQSLMTSPSYRLQGGLIGATGTQP